MKLTKTQAKEWSILIWTWLAEHPSERKENLPEHLKTHIFVNKNETDIVVKHLGKETYSCPLCTLFYSPTCKGCPLGGVKCTTLGFCHPSFHAWWIAVGNYRGEGPEKAKEHAENILRLIKEWNPSERMKKGETK